MNNKEKKSGGGDNSSNFACTVKPILFSLLQNYFIFYFQASFGYLLFDETFIIII